MNDLPLPSEEALAHSQALTQHIQKKIIAQGGKITVQEYSALALYAPGLGYYTAGAQKFGPSGDFVTAPEISPLFGQSLGYFCEQVLDNLPTPNINIILELGAGSGKLARDILDYLSQKNKLPCEYWILEVSADLKARQQDYLQLHCPDWFPRIRWLSALPSTPFQGIILANEIIDALPVHIFQINQKKLYQELYITDQFAWSTGPLSSTRLQNALSDIAALKNPELPTPYQSEILLDLDPWIASLSAILESGVMLFIDYGFGESEYYHPARDQGTLMCHYRHHAHQDVFLYPGLQDITAHVNFSAVAHAGTEAGLTLLHYNNQANFLIDNQFLKFAEQAFTLENRFPLSQQIQTLLQPHEMGELFKVMVLSKAFPGSLDYLKQDCRHRL